ncbi:MAG: GH3 auxin-responsive promoter family protein [Planctomycetaceae bacterium]
MARAFFARLHDPRAVQHEVLGQLLALNADSDFSRRHRLHQVRTAADLRRHLPIVDYDYYRPYIDRLKAGDHGALLGRRNRPVMFALTSGTTSDSKYIPITKRFLTDYRRGWSVWGIRAYDDHPALHRQNIMQLASDHDQFRTPGGAPCGNISGLVQAMQSPILKTMYTVPDVVTKIKSPEAKYYAALRLSMADPGVGLVMTANPSTLLQIARLGNAHKHDLIRDIAQGTLSTRFEYAPEVRRALARRLGRGNAARARELERIANRTGALLPRDYWPQLTLLGVWTGGSAGAYTAGLRQCFGSVPIRDHGLSASEGRMTIPFADHDAAGILDVGTHYFEFIPEAEHGSADPTVLEAHELREGENYYIILTTSSGLYRYDIRDVVRCTGFAGGTPLLEFLNKGAHISSVTGEKISESQVVAALRRATSELGVDLSHYTVTPVWGDPPGYRLLVEETDLIARELGERLSALVDAHLQRLNMEYGEKRATGRLRSLVPVYLPPGSWLRFARARQSKLGGSVEQYKHPCLAPDLAFCEVFLRDFAGQLGERAA